MRYRLEILFVLLLAPLTWSSARTSNFTPEDIPVFEGRHAAAPAGDDGELTVVSYNIQFGRHIEAALRDLRSDARVAAADILLLQEMDAEGCERLARGLGLNYVYYAASVHRKHGRLFGNAVLSPWPIARHEAVFLPHDNPLNGQRRIAVVAEVMVDGSAVRAVSTHTETPLMPRGQRLDQLRAVARHLPGDEPTVLAGDLNTLLAGDVSLSRRVLEKAGLAPARLPAGSTIRQRLLRWLGGSVVLDHIFYRGLEVLDTGIERRATASDHLPVWASFRRPVPALS